jgi:acyl-coenzyme A synthetase/AMP-(fatty) acid ligase
MSRPRTKTLRGALAAAGDLGDRAIHDAETSAAFGAILAGSSFGPQCSELARRSVLVVTDSQLAAAVALIELDGLARRILVCPPDLAPEHLPSIIADAEIDAIVSDRAALEFDGLGIPVFACGLPITAGPEPVDRENATEWVLLTSGTTGPPKMVVHNLHGLTAAIAEGSAHDRQVVWGTFYDIRRYGGLQVFLRAVLTPASLVLSNAGERIAAHLRRLAAHGVTHLSGTPSHWRRALMSPAAGEIAPEYVRLSGEIADQPILDSLRQAYGRARIGHAYASTEAGVGFAVDDGREGFPTTLTERATDDVEMKIEGGSLRIRSSRAASRYLGSTSAPLNDHDGFVDTGDIVELRGDRYHFVGRRGGIINVGGLKVHPEEVEAAINRHESVKMSLVKARKSPITGAIVVAEIVLKDEAAAAWAASGGEGLKNDILRFCRDSLAHHKIPAVIRFVPALDVTPGGKLARRHA